MTPNLLRIASALATVVAIALVGCASTSEHTTPGGADENPGGETLCARAAAHLSACALDLPAPEPVALGGACDAAVAASVLSTDCAVLSAQFGEGKADSPLGSLACRLGFFAACPVPACPDSEPEASPAPERAPGRPPETAASAPEAAPEPDQAPDTTATAPEPVERACTRFLGAADDCRLCAYYDCRERTAECGPDAYLVDYARRYCERFALVTEPRVSPAASAWLKRVRRCLAEWLEENVADDADCETIDRDGTASHAVCYVETGFCQLSVSDWLGVLHSVDPGDAPFRVMLATAQGCLGEWLGLDTRARE